MGLHYYPSYYHSAAAEDAVAVPVVDVAAAAERVAASSADFAVLFAVAVGIVDFGPLMHSSQHPSRR